MSALAISLCAMAGDVAERFVKRSGLQPGSVAVEVVDLATGHIVEEYNGDVPLVPASIMKAVTTASLTMTEQLDNRFYTDVYTCGRLHRGVLDGDILVVGSGDPTLNGHSEPGSADILEEVVAALKKEGVKEVNGRIIVDQSLFKGPDRPESWCAGDRAQSYGTGCHALNFQQNCSGKRSVENPAAVFSSRLADAMRRNGIELHGRVLEDGKRKLLLRHESAPLDEIMRSCMMRSDNLFAEALLRRFAIASDAGASVQEAASKEMSLWKSRKAPMENVNIVDGSGLSRSNRVTANFMTSVLCRMSGNPYYASFFPLAGQEGTLRNLLLGTPLEGYLAMKTGSMNGIQCYAGYKLDDDYAPTHSVVVIVNNMNVARAKVRSEVAAMLKEIFPTP